MTLQQGEERPGSFEERLGAARARQGRAKQDADAPLDVAGSLMGRDDTPSPLGIGMRVGIELVSALVVAVGIGWLLDRWLHTTPLFIAVFVLLGGAAGVLNVWRMMGPRSAGSRVRDSRSSGSR